LKEAERQHHQQNSNQPMKLLKRDISSKDGSGFVSLLPTTPEDLWHTYNLLQTGDRIRCTTLRKVNKESSTGSVTSTKVRMNLTIEVTKVEFFKDSLEVRISGPNSAESAHVRMGAFHTLTLEIDRQFSIEKQCWDQIYLDRIDEACNPDRGADIAAVVMSGGLAHVCLVTGSVTVTKARIDMNIPKKRTGSSAHSKAITKFHDAIYRAVLTHVPFDKVKCILLGSPGFQKDDFYKYLLSESVRRDDRPYIENKAKFVLCHSSSGHKCAIEELFSDPSILSKVTETKLSKEIEILNKFMRLLDTHPDKAYYGYLHVQKANEELAIDSLLISDELFRSSDVVTRKKYVALVESVRERGGTVYVFSTMHVSGQQLQQVSGVAAILRYPMPDLVSDHCFPWL
jgi:protein pelota